ncbi:SLC13 family permease [Streptomyces sp. NPDC058665]|uniref:SLC13 family permease n=1 Tax=Streptomyces sp. NPDC058665 TaxID=3346586 RepID=UPI00364B6DE8
MGITAWLAVGVFAGVYVLIATEWVHRVKAALGGAVIMLALGVTDAEHAFFSEEAGIDWNVIFLLLGMMLIVSVLKRTGVFEFIAIWAAKRARGKPYRLMVLLILATAVLSPWLDNVTTVLLIAPVTILVCNKLGLPVVPYLIAEVMACNISGAATLIGDPPNIIIGSRAGLSFNDFLLHMTPIVVVLMVVFVLMSRVMFRKAFRYDPERAKSVMEMDERAAIKNPGLLKLSGIVLLAVMAGFVLHTTFHIEPSVVAITGGLVLLALSRLDTEEVARDVEWETLAFFTGLFVMVGAMVQIGVIGDLGELAAEATEGELLGTSMALVLRTGRHCGHHRDRRGVRVAALLRPGVTPAARTRRRHGAADHSHRSGGGGSMHAHDEDRQLDGLADRLRHDDPRFAADFAQGRPRRPREYRRGTAWLTLAVGLVLLGAGIALGHGLLLAGGLVVSGAAGHLFDPNREQIRRGTPPPS